MASVAKWLRQWFVVPPFVGSSPIVRPYSILSDAHLALPVMSNSNSTKNVPLKI